MERCFLNRKEEREKKRKLNILKDLVTIIKQLEEIPHCDTINDVFETMHLLSKIKRTDSYHILLLKYK